MSTGNSLSWLVLFSLISIRYARTWPYCTAFILDNGCRLSSSHAPPVNCPLRMATSSKKLENKQSVRSTKDPKYKGISNNVVSRLAKASREATMSRRKKGTPASTTTMETALQGGENYFQNEDTIRSLSSIANLNNVIDEELLHPTDGYRPSRVLTDSMRLLLEHNCHYDEHSRQESFISSSASSTSTSKSAKSSSKKCMKNNGMQINQIDVAIVFARPPIEGKISIEYAFRLLSLVKAVKFDGYKPNLICFFGSSTYIPLDPKEVSVTSSGVNFFKHLCMFNDISLSGISLCEIPLLSNTDITPVPKYKYDDSYQTLSDQHVSSHVTSSWSPSLTPIAKELVDQHYIEKWLDESDAYESEMDEYGMTRQEPRKKIHIHLKLFSTEYHLCNLNDIDYRSPRQSPLTRLVHDLEHSASSKHHRRGIIQTSWSFYHTNYPYVMSSDKNKMKEAFLGKCYLMAQSLVPLLVNLRGVANNVSFIRQQKRGRRVTVHSKTCM